MIVCGVTTVIGLAAANHVVEVHKPRQDTYKEQQPTEAMNVMGKKSNQEIVQQDPAQVNI